MIKLCFFSICFIVGEYYFIAKRNNEIRSCNLIKREILINKGKCMYVLLKLKRIHVFVFRELLQLALKNITRIRLWQWCQPVIVKQIFLTCMQQDILSSTHHDNKCLIHVLREEDTFLFVGKLSMPTFDCGCVSFSEHTWHCNNGNGFCNPLHIVCLSFPWI